MPLIAVVGMVGADARELSPAARQAVRSADVVVGGTRLLADMDALVSPRARRVIVGGDLAPALDEIAEAVGRVCVLGSGDPGWFGIGRVLAARFGREALAVHPAASSVAIAFARLGLPWDDATVVSAHGRPLVDATRLLARCPKAAVLAAPNAPPQAIGAGLRALGAVHEHAAVCARLGLADEEVAVTDLPGLAVGSWDPLAVVVLWSGTGVAPVKSLAWGLPEAAHAHRAAMITKSEVRSVVIGLLALPAPAPVAPVLWDVGAGSGSVAVECAGLAPWMEVIAVEHDQQAAATIAANARDHGVALRVAEGAAPAALEDLPDPDRVFVGGGGLEVLTAARRRLRGDGIVVATHAALDRASAAATLLGNLTQVAASRGRVLPDGGWRLEAANPVFVTWGTA